MMEKLIKKKVIAVDFGGTNIRAALAQSDSTLLHSVRLPTKAEAGQKLLTLAGDIEAITANHVQQIFEIISSNPPHLNLTPF